MSSQFCANSLKARSEDSSAGNSISIISSWTVMSRGDPMVVSVENVLTSKVALPEMNRKHQVGASSGSTRDRGLRGEQLD